MNSEHSVFLVDSQKLLKKTSKSTRHKRQQLRAVSLNEWGRRPHFRLLTSTLNMITDCRFFSVNDYNKMSLYAYVVATAHNYHRRAKNVKMRTHFGAIQHSADHILISALFSVVNTVPRTSHNLPLHFRHPPVYARVLYLVFTVRYFCQVLIHKQILSQSDATIICEDMIYRIIRHFMRNFQYCHFDNCTTMDWECFSTDQYVSGLNSHHSKHVQHSIIMYIAKLVALNQIDTYTSLWCNILSFIDREHCSCWHGLHEKNKNRFRKVCFTFTKNKHLLQLQIFNMLKIVFYHKNLYYPENMYNSNYSDCMKARLFAGNCSVVPAEFIKDIEHHEQDPVNKVFIWCCMSQLWSLLFSSEPKSTCDVDLQDFVTNMMLQDLVVSLLFCD